MSIASARYGKDNVRVFHNHRDPVTKVHTVTEMTVCCLLEGEIDTSYTKADNSVVVATDSIKNTIYITAKQHPVNPPELYAAILGSHLVDTYAHIHTANISVKVKRWTRLNVNGQPHPHSFMQDGEETRNVEAVVSKKNGISLSSSIVGLTVLKSTGSAFHGFLRDEYTSLKETWDRILSTDVSATWNWETLANVDAVKKLAEADAFNAAWQTAREVTLRWFAEDESASVQNTMYKMAEEILSKVPEIKTVGYELPNKHYFEIDLSWHKGLKNTGTDAEVYAPQTSPNGLIKCEVARK